MKNTKLNLLICFCILIFSLTTNGIISLNMNHLYISKTLKSSADELVITTPESKTYTSPMSGYYPASYGFESDENATVPHDWINASSGSCSISVQNQKDQHNKVVQLNDGDTGPDADVIAQYNFVSHQISGTVECWVYKESGDCALVIQGNNASTIAFIISIDAYNNGVFRYSPDPGAYIHFAPDLYFDQTWYQIRIDFDCITGTIDIYLNGKLEITHGSFYLPVSEISNIQIRSGYSGTGILFFDAVGFSGDTNYNTGDNLNEGLLLSYEKSIDFEWIGYSLDGHSNRTIYGNTTIPMPDIGRHSIQIFANDTLGINYESEIRYFSVSSSNPSIPSYNFPLILGIITIFSIISIRKKKQKM